MRKILPKSGLARCALSWTQSATMRTSPGVANCMLEGGPLPHTRHCRMLSWPCCLRIRRYKPLDLRDRRASAASTFDQKKVAQPN